MYQAKLSYAKPAFNNLIEDPALLIAMFFILLHLLS